MQDTRKSDNTIGLLLLIGFVVFDVVLWYGIFAHPGMSGEGLYLLDVGQGDSTFVELSSGAKMLTDAGPDTKVVRSLKKIMPERTYIDIAVISHPQLDHFAGFRPLLSRYRFGVFLVNGREAEEGAAKKAWDDLIAEIDRRGIPIVTVGEGDRITQKKSRIDILSPDPLFGESGELNDTAIVEHIRSGNLNALLTADIGANVESYLLKRYPELSADILKVGHHGSKFSSSEAFLTRISPRIALVGVGNGNRYGHPSPAALRGILGVGAEIFRTDIHGTIGVRAHDGTLFVSHEK